MAAAERAGRFFKLFENFVFYPPVVKAKALVDAGAIGEPLFVRIKSNFGNPRHGWPIPVAARPGGWTPSAAAAARSCSTTATTSSRSPGGSWACPRRSMPGSARTAVEGGTVDGPAVISFRFPGDRMGVFEAVHSARPPGRHAPLRAGRPGRDHRHQGRALGHARPRQDRRPAARDPLRRRRDRGILRHADRLGGELHRLHAADHPAPCSTASRPA